jgi:hypothetical protein
MRINTLLFVKRVLNMVYMLLKRIPLKLKEQEQQALQY